jgi:hypothetical protein
MDCPHDHRQCMTPTLCTADPCWRVKLVPQTRLVPGMQPAGGPDRGQRGASRAAHVLVRG